MMGFSTLSDGFMIFHWWCRYSEDRVCTLLEGMCPHVKVLMQTPMSIHICATIMGFPSLDGELAIFRWWDFPYLEDRVCAFLDGICLGVAIGIGQADPTPLLLDPYNNRVGSTRPDYYTGQKLRPKPDPDLVGWTRPDLFDSIIKL